MYHGRFDDGRPGKKAYPIAAIGKVMTYGCSVRAEVGEGEMTHAVDNEQPSPSSQALDAIEALVRACLQVA
jgi:hypothetical protein